MLLSNGMILLKLNMMLIFAILICIVIVYLVFIMYTMYCVIVTFIGYMSTYSSKGYMVDDLLPRLVHFQVYTFMSFITFHEPSSSTHSTHCDSGHANYSYISHMHACMHSRSECVIITEQYVSNYK